MKPTHWLVQIAVEDPGCVFSVNPSITYKKIVNAFSSNAAVRAAANYCTKYMKLYPGAHFKYFTQGVEPYYYPVRVETQLEDSTGVKRTKI